MEMSSSVALVASLASEPTRAAILTALLDGRLHPAGDLAYMAGIKPQTASFHLAKMVEAGVISVTKQGRHRYYGIPDQQVAQVMESLLSISRPGEIRSLRQAQQDERIRMARTCYDHIAGKLGVQIASSLLNLGVLEADQGQNQFKLTEEGENFFSRLQIDVAEVKRRRRSFSHKCLDWSERQHHLAGSLGEALLHKMIELQWIERLPDTRAIRVTDEGRQALQERFLIEI
ncbi:ArsR family transcriptional regulator [Paenibacillus zeisoli]|uniref:ArsR family transcriptional regulator n=1 Tax=Paenibacillus zeisoli TaxID=2496267 RepID=A0A433XCY1_9BACL|nr:winged helix-turn-helix domain-containing protein [Paenibacillus zeisoli]RUT31989.1 ArsR family transcriptional regulator [Paenibacillus zeisoli]